MLELNGLYKVFNAGTVNEKRAIDGLDLTLEEGDFVCLLYTSPSPRDRG